MVGKEDAPAGKVAVVSIKGTVHHAFCHLSHAPLVMQSGSGLNQRHGDLGFEQAFAAFP
jgi:hypothetical protein